MEKQLYKSPFLEKEAMKKILLVMPTVARVVDGGVATQALRTFEETKKLGVALEQYNPWESYNWDEIAAVHIFCANLESLNIAKAVHEKSIPLIVSSVFFSSHRNNIIKAELLFSSILQKIFSGIRTSFDYLKEICTMADLVLPNTENEKEKLIEAIGIPAQKITVIPNGVDARFINADPMPFQNKYGASDYILSVANLGYRRKNALNLIKALQNIEHPAFLIGPYFDTAYGQACKKELKKAPHIKWIGALKNDSPLLASAFAGAKVFALPSLFETPGIASMEAALSNTTIVTTPYGGTIEYFGAHALYANPNSVQDIESNIREALQRNSSALKEHIQENFLWKKVAKKMKDIYITYLK